MAKPSTEARLAAAAKGFTQVIGRGNAHIITKNPMTGKCAYDGQVGGGWHYNGDQETDTAWEADSDQNYLKMVKAGYNLRARKLFNAGDLIKWTDPVSGQYVKFQPQNFQWIDGTTGSNSLISVAQAVASPSIDDDKLYWPAAFGSGRHFRYTAAPTKLIKHLIIDSAANLPACPTWITNPWLELTFTLTPSSGVIMYVDGLAWDQSTSKTTANAIEFRLPSGEVVWSMDAPLAYDSSEMGEPCGGHIKLYVNKKIKYAAVRFPKSWIDTAQFPITLDPTVDYQVGANANDGYWGYPGFSAAECNVGCYTSGSTFVLNCFARWTGITIPSGATIDVAYISSYYGSKSGTPSDCKIYFDDSDAPTAPTTTEEANAKTKTTAYINQNPPVSGTWNNTGSIKTIIDELFSSYGPYSNGAMQMLWMGGGSGTNYTTLYDYVAASSKAMKLHIEYTEAASGNPFYAYAQM